MAEDIQTAAPGEGQQQNIQVVVDERDMRTVYTNAYRMQQAAEEVIVDFGFNMIAQAQGGGPPTLNFKVTDRVVMTYVNAKRLAMSLGQLIKRYEQQFGELPTQPGPRK